MTGIVGVNRDILGTGLGARPIANTDVFCFGPPNWEGDLDPIKGMYWEWRTGYIDLKVEGNSPASNERKNDVFFHLGGFLKHESTQHLKTLNFPKDNECIEVDLTSFFQAVDLSRQHKIMRPGKEAVKLSHIWKDCWQIGTR